MVCAGRLPEENRTAMDAHSSQPPPAMSQSGRVQGLVLLVPRIRQLTCWRETECEELLQTVCKKFPTVGSEVVCEVSSTGEELRMASHYVAGVIFAIVMGRVSPQALSLFDTASLARSHHTRGAFRSTWRTSP